MARRISATGANLGQRFKRHEEGGMINWNRAYRSDSSSVPEEDNDPFEMMLDKAIEVAFAPIIEEQKSKLANRSLMSNAAENQALEPIEPSGRMGPCHPLNRLD